MKTAIRAFLGFIFGTAFGLLLYWVRGGSFMRGEDLGMAVLGSCYIGVFFAFLASDPLRGTSE
jgi:hypothetical protein